MNKYRIEVTETSMATYIVEANSQSEADNLFAGWAENHQEWIYDDLSDGSFGWEYSSAKLVNESIEPDITYEEMIK